MSRNDEFIMEILDGEVPEAYQNTVNQQVSADPEASRLLERYRSVKSIMAQADQAMNERYGQAEKRLKQRLDRSLAAAQSARRPGLKNLLDFTSGQWLRVPLPAAAAAMVVLVALAVLNFVPGIRPSEQSLAQAPTGMNVVNHSEFSDIDPNFMGLLSVNNEAAPAPNPNAAEDGGINLQINVQDVEQLLRLLEEARNRNTGINDITIQIPSDSNFQMLGDSQLRRVQPRGAQ